MLKFYGTKTPTHKKILKLKKSPITARKIYEYLTPMVFNNMKIIFKKSKEIVLWLDRHENIKLYMYNLDEYPNKYS